MVGSSALAAIAVRALVVVPFVAAAGAAETMAATRGDEQGETLAAERHPGAYDPDLPLGEAPAVNRNAIRRASSRPETSFTSTGPPSLPVTSVALSLAWT